eukprot:12907161-Prorocentrum_lima.AAC.1
MESWRPEHQVVDPMTLAEAMGKEPATRRRGSMICPPCELECRKNEWPQLTEAGRAAHPNHAPMSNLSWT